MLRETRNRSEASLPYNCRMEIGPWFEGGSKISVDEIQSRLRHRDTQTNSISPSSSIYVHVPFCPRRCSYCALYTRAISRNADSVLDEFTDMIELAVRNHPDSFSGRKSTTVHFGGGTPLFLGHDRFYRIVKLLEEAFDESHKCEWAVETTASAMDDRTVGLLRKLRIMRIHLGVQTLDDEIRKQIRRRESGDAVLERIRSLAGQDFLVSADLILGFDHQTEVLVQQDLARLYEAGIRMFSICELRNLRGQRNTPEIAFRNFKLWRVLWNFMKMHGLTPIHMGQFGRSDADNLYYTHPVRGEDCVAIGPYAHGSSGDMMYANMLIPEYYRAVRQKKLPVQFGVVVRDRESHLLEFEKQLLGHHILPSLVRRLRTLSEQFCFLWDHWMEKELVFFSEKRKCFQPSCEGSWFIGNLATELRQLADTQEWKQ